MHVTCRIRGGDTAPQVRVVNDRGEHVNGGNKRTTVWTPPYGRVVSGLVADQKVRVCGWGQGAQNLRQVAWT